MKHNIPRLHFDTELINADISIREAIAMYTDINPYVRGNISCPSSTHKDKKPSAHIYEDSNRCKCFGCGCRYDPISLAKEYYPTLSFPDLCRKILEDFDMDIRQYSNIEEVEKAKDAADKDIFYDVFPITSDEMSFIGLHNPSWNGNESFAVSRAEYDKAMGYDSQCDETYPDTIYISKNEAAELGFISPDEKKWFKATPTLQEIWKNDKDFIEEMIMNKCQEKMDSLVEEIESIRETAAVYQRTHTPDDIKAVNKFRDAFIAASVTSFKSGKEVTISEVRRNQINELYAFESSQQDIISLHRSFEKAEGIMKKVQDHRKEREACQNQTKSQKESWSK